MRMELFIPLENDKVSLTPVKPEDFERLYAVASDPLIWEQHPSKERYKREVFEVYFKGAIESGTAYLITEKNSGEVMGSTRYYGYDPVKSEVNIGYTFLARKFWGGKYNPSVKRLMLQNAFRLVDRVHFHVGASNLRSQKAMEKLGAKKIGEKQMSYYGERDNLNFIYEISKENFL
jgi:RimJ/RimL family protein N-acetyltransferase